MTLTPANSIGGAVAFSGTRWTLASLSVANGAEIEWPTEAYDEGGYANGDPTPARLVAPADGYYLATIFLYDAAAAMAGCNIVQNAGGVPSNVLITGGAGSMNGATVVHLVAGDTLSARYFGDNPTEIDAGAISVSRLG